MKPLDNEIDSSQPLSSAEECAALVADIVPLVMRTIRAEMRRHRSADLSVPQFRTLAFLGRNPDASLSDVAEHIGLTLPSISKMVDRLEARELLMRRGASDDRRRLCLELTPLGRSTLQSAANMTRDHLAEKLAALSPDECSIISQAMNSLHRVFGPEPTPEDGSDR
jgi:DNA-binding MarR family transcriptional regulator